MKAHVIIHRLKKAGIYDTFKKNLFNEGRWTSIKDFAEFMENFGSSLSPFLFTTCAFELSKTPEGSAFWVDKIMILERKIQKNIELQTCTA